MQAPVVVLTNFVLSCSTQSAAAASMWKDVFDCLPTEVGSISSVRSSGSSVLALAPPIELETSRVDEDAISVDEDAISIDEDGISIGMALSMASSSLSSSSLPSFPILA